MKQLTAILCLLPILCFSQKQFAPLGATWKYEGPSYWDGNILDCVGNHLRYVVEEELIIDGKDCSLIRAYGSNNIDTTMAYTGDSLVVWENEEKIYFHEDNGFLLLFDFGAELGDTIVRYDPINRGAFSGVFYQDTATTSAKMEMYVHEIEEINLNGQTLSVKTMMNTDPDTELVRSDQILEGVGSLSAMFSGQYLFTVAEGCDGHFICYEKDNFLYPLDSDCEYKFLDAVDESWQENISISPNPFGSHLQIATDITELELNLYNLNGELVRTAVNQYAINTENLFPGAYLLQLTTNKGILTRKLIKL